jgi:hypothetical protein
MPICKHHRTVLRHLSLTPNQVWGLTRTDGEWSAALEAALTASRRGDLKHGTNARVRGGLCLQRLPGAPGVADGEGPDYLIRDRHIKAVACERFG